MKKNNYTKIVIYIICFVGVCALTYTYIVNRDIVTTTRGGQIIDSKDTASRTASDSYKWPYMIKYENKGDDYIEIKFGIDSPSKIMCSKADYAKIISGHYYYVNYSYNKKNYKNVKLLGIYDHDPNAR
ncbi:hypothetical protein LL037_13465 [Clostridium estertheticum]|uniref:hypothetical protein n=1 Tax=Clostridium estertheticum TaxID=238834 RepID=UPI001C0E224E|nr:hypothetical protein [Clostridium estertheticum]MBU3201449.1 hypothetical protein [Clostridium estertheticum]WAG63498.1 hypothetical protein LL037_13465 [Clostridium estertheticum]